MYLLMSYLLKNSSTPAYSVVIISNIYYSVNYLRKLIQTVPIKII